MVSAIPNPVLPNILPPKLLRRILAYRQVISKNTIGIALSLDLPRSALFLYHTSQMWCQACSLLLIVDSHTAMAPALLGSRRED
jgi:hypothetical protein